MIEQELYAFWKYDLFPYCCGGKVTKILPKGSVETKQHGPGYCFIPFLIVPVEQGEEIQSQLNVLLEEYRIEQNKFQQEFKEKLNKIIKIPKE